MHRARRHNLGFTLIEVLVASAIMAMLAATLMVSLHTAFKARRSATSGLAAGRAARLAMSAIGRDLHAALPPTGVFRSTFEGQDGSSDWGTTGDTLTFSNTADPIRGVSAAGDVEQVTLALISDAQLQTDQAAYAASGLAGVSNASMPGMSPSAGLGAPSGGVSGAGKPAAGALVMPPPPDSASGAGVLVRRVTRNLLASMVPPPDDQVICRQVRSLNLRYFDGTQWQDSWDSTAQSNALPKAVEVTIEIADMESAAAGAPADKAPSYSVVSVYYLPCGPVSVANQ